MLSLDYSGGDGRQRRRYSRHVRILIWASLYQLYATGRHDDRKAPSDQSRASFLPYHAVLLPTTGGRPPQKRLREAGFSDHIKRWSRPDSPRWLNRWCNPGLDLVTAAHTWLGRAAPIGR